MRLIVGLLVGVSAVAGMPVGFERGIWPSLAAHGDEQQQQPATTQATGESETLDNTPKAATTYTGGALEGIRKVSENQYTSLGLTSWVNLQGATASWFVPASDSDLLNVDFSGECRLINSAISHGNQDSVEIRVKLTRAPTATGFPQFMQPYDVTTPMAFCSAAGYGMHHASFAARVTGGTGGANYTVQVQARIANYAPTANPPGPLYAWLDDWMLELAAYN